MDKRAKVFMLPTNEKAKSNLLLGRNELYYSNKLSNFSLKEDIDRFQHLYITSDDEIKEGDWITDGKKVYKAPNIDGFIGLYKIIATTDSSLFIDNSTTSNVDYRALPQPSQQFIEKYVEEYNKGNQIVNVLVEYDLDIDDNFVSNAVKETAKQTYSYKDSWKPKVSKDNTITIRKVKDSWSRDEVVELIKKYSNECTGQPWFDTDDKWIEENL